MSDHFQDLYFKRTVGLDNEKISCYNPLSGGSCNQQYIIETEDSSNFAEEEVCSLFTQVIFSTEHDLRNPLLIIICILAFSHNSNNCMS